MVICCKNSDSCLYHYSKSLVTCSSDSFINIEFQIFEFFHQYFSVLRSQKSRNPEQLNNIPTLLCSWHVQQGMAPLVLCPYGFNKAFSQFWNSKHVSHNIHWKDFDIQNANFVKLSDEQIIKVGNISRRKWNCRYCKVASSNTSQ